MIYASGLSWAIQTAWCLGWLLLSLNQLKVHKTLSHRSWEYVACWKFPPTGSDVTWAGTSALSCLSFFCSDYFTRCKYFKITCRPHAPSGDDGGIIFRDGVGYRSIVWWLDKWTIDDRHLSDEQTNRRFTSRPFVWWLYEQTIEQ